MPNYEVLNITLKLNIFLVHTVVSTNFYVVLNVNYKSIMVMITKSYRYLLSSKCYDYLIKATPNVTFKVPTKKLHNTNNVYSKMFTEHENKYAFNIMQNNGYPIGFNIDLQKSQFLTKEYFLDILEKNWLKEAPQTIFQLLPTLGEYCTQHKICISSEQFDNYIDALTDSIQFATDEELKSLFYALAKWPQTESIKTRNYIEVWAALDDECLKRIKNWSTDEMFSFVSLFYMLNATKVSEFVRKCLLKMTSRAKKLTKSQVVQTLFFIGVVRKSPPDIHNMEVYLEDNFSQFSVDELAIIAMGLFKSKTPIRSMTLLSSIIEKVSINSRQIHEVSLAALLKIIRYSAKKSEDNKIFDLMNSLYHEISRLSIMCNVQMALVGTSTLTLHEDCLTKIAETTMKSMSTARLKDLERLVLTYGTFNFRPNTKLCLFSMILDELRKPERAKEIEQHSRSFACCIAYFGLLEIYPVDLMNKILNRDFLEHTYGKHCQLYGREILTIHNKAKIFAIKEIVNLLPDNQVVILSKKYTDYIPKENYEKQYNLSEKMFLDVVRVLRDMRGGKQFVTADHIITHHQRGDIIICNNSEGVPLPVDKAFTEHRFGFLIKPPNKNIWVALIIAGKNTIIQETNIPTGHFSVKIKELNALGFHAAIVNWNIYSKLETDDQKVVYLNAVIKEATSSKL